MGDDEFTAYVAARWPRLVQAARLLGADPGEAEDLVQTTLVKCYRSWDRVHRADRVDAYVHRVLVNTWLRSRERRWHGEVPTADLPEDGVPRDDHETALDLQRLLGRLSPDHRAVLVLRYVADLTEQQAAEALGVPVGTVKSRAARALAALDTDQLREETR